MTIRKILLAMIFFASCLSKQLNAQQPMNSGETLDRKQQSLVAISALTANGNLVPLKQALAKGLDAGLTVNKIKEALVHLYAYCGFPRSIRGLQTFMSVLAERKSKGINDILGAEPSPVQDQRSKYDRGKEILEKLTGVQQQSSQTGYSAFAPAIDTFLKEHLFADIFERDILSFTERELVTVSVLGSLDGVEPMLQAHLNICLNVGLTPNQLKQFVSILKATSGDNKAQVATSVLDQVLKK